MRLSDLIGREVRADGGQRVGVVSDVRLVQDGPQLGGAASYRVAGLLVTPRHHPWATLGYERRERQGPWLVSVVLRRLLRGSRYYRWTDVVDMESDVVVLGPDAPALPLDTEY